VKVEMQVDTAEVDALFRRLDRQYSKDIVKALDVTAQKGIQMILERTEKGKGYTGRFLPYTADYAKFRAKKGRQTAFVDLNFSGRMTSSIKRLLDKPKLTATLEFSRANEAKKAAGLNVKRPFFGFNNREQQFLKKFFYGVLVRK